MCFLYTHPALKRGNKISGQSQIYFTFILPTIKIERYVWNMKLLYLTALGAFYFASYKEQGSQHP